MLMNATTGSECTPLGQKTNKNNFAVAYAFYGQRLVVAAWTYLSPWSIQPEIKQPKLAMTNF